VANGSTATNRLTNVDAAKANAASRSNSMSTT
jgi:hypothetical protein